MSQSNQFDKFKRIIERSSSLSIENLCLAIQMDKKDLLPWIYDLPNVFGFIIHDDKIEFDQEKIHEHIDELMAEFERMELTQEGKLEVDEVKKPPTKLIDSGYIEGNKEYLEKQIIKNIERYTFVSKKKQVPLIQIARKVKQPVEVVQDILFDLIMDGKLKARVEDKDTLDISDDILILEEGWHVEKERERELEQERKRKEKLKRELDKIKAQIKQFVEDDEFDEAISLVDNTLNRSDLTVKYTGEMQKFQQNILTQKKEYQRILHTKQQEEILTINNKINELVEIKQFKQAIEKIKQLLKLPGIASDEVKSWKGRLDQLQIELAKTENEIVVFRRIKLIKLEVDILKEIEKSTGELPLVNEIKYDIFGFQVKENSVIGLGSYNKELTSLPESITNLVNLQKLDLRKNQLNSLPESLTKLVKLQELMLVNNQFTSLP